MTGKRRDRQDEGDSSESGCAMVEQKQKSYTIITPMGYEMTVIHMSREDIERELARFEAKYGMASREFAAKWNAGELDCAIMDYFVWAGNCSYMHIKHGIEELEIIHTNVQELKIA